ncbi:GroES family chaperonin [Isoptericola aurantiacus]|uniref:GroES family chaperonin n=1 Tax=Isoptericola aurantiacus TaxID=3377839 RepID=UPI00383B6D26
MSPAASSTTTTDDGTLEPLPIRMLHDRVLVDPEVDSAERQSSAGLVIPATATGPKRLAWARVVARGEHVRQVAVGDRVLYDPEERAEVELGGTDYVLLRERDVHAVAERADPQGTTGLYL